MERSPSKVRLWERPLPLQRQDSNKNDFIDKFFINKLKKLENPLPQGLEWIDYDSSDDSMANAIASFYHTNFILGAGQPPQQFTQYVHYRLNANPPNLILIIGEGCHANGTSKSSEDESSAEEPQAGSTRIAIQSGTTARIVAIMISESFTALNQGREVPVLTIGGLAVAEEWRGVGLVVTLFKQIAKKVTGEHMHLFNLKKDGRLYPCAEIPVWWYPINVENCLKMTLFRLEPSPSQATLQLMASKITKEFSFLPCRKMREYDVGFVKKSLNKQNNMYALARIWNETDVAKWLLPRPKVQYSYIVTDETGTQKLDFFAFHMISYNFAEADDVMEVKVAVPGYYTTRNTRPEDMLKFVMYAAKSAGADYIHGYGALGYCKSFPLLGFIRNDKEVHYLQMFNWETRNFRNDEIGIPWIQF